jgi:hypothetical protein
MRALDVSGQRFGRLVAVRRLPSSASRRTLWECLCDCGARKSIPLVGLRKRTRSCGCQTSELIAASKRTHDDIESLEYSSWANMHSRCSDPSRYRYGERGIKVCERWNEYENFLADMGRRPSPAHSLDRVNNDGNYEPSNCRWATRKEQTLNRREDWGRVLALGEESMSLTRWAARLGISVPGLIQRIRRWGNVEKALTTPVPERYR